MYLDAFAAAQREPLEAWRTALRGEAGYRMHVRLAFDGDRLVGGVCYELYPRSRCGLVTYLVVAPGARGRGVGRRLFDEAAHALYAAGALAAFGEVHDPRVHGETARARLERFLRWGARIVGIRYVQPALGAGLCPAPSGSVTRGGDGLARDRGLCLIVHPPVPDISGDVVRAFIAELYALTERRAPDAELAALLAGIPDRIEMQTER